jgi:BolA protein
MIYKRLSTCLKTTHLEIIDESYKHKGHLDVDSPMTHIKIKIQSPLFEGKTLVQKHRMIYDALGELMPHAASIEIL